MLFAEPVHRHWQPICGFLPCSSPLSDARHVSALTAMRMLACAALPAWRLWRAAFDTRTFVRARRNRLLRIAPCDVPLVAQGRTNFTNTWPKHVLVHVSFAPFVRILARACQVLNGLCFFKICAKGWFYLQNSHFLVNFAAGYEVRSRTLPHRFCEINSFY